VRPFIDEHCGSCHGASALNPDANLTLGGPGVTSTQVLAGLLGVKASNGEFDLIAPGDAERSWVYVKASDGVSSVACSSACNRGPMPPAGQRLTAAELMLLAQWINDGARLDP
jgi:hypothetical protein